MNWKRQNERKNQADETKQTKTNKTSFMYIHVRGTLPLIKVLWNTFVSVWQSVSATVFVTIPIESIFKLIKSNVALFVWYIFVTINCVSNKTKFSNWSMMYSMHRAYSICMWERIAIQSKMVCKFFFLYFRIKCFVSAAFSFGLVWFDLFCLRPTKRTNERPTNRQCCWRNAMCF